MKYLIFKGRMVAHKGGGAQNYLLEAVFISHNVCICKYLFISYKLQCFILKS